MEIASTPGFRAFGSDRFRLVVALVLALIGVALNWVYLQTLWDSPVPWLEDFEPYYVAAERMLAGQSPYTAAQLSAPVDAVCPGCYLYPPFLAQISAPLSAFPIEVAKVGWFTILSLAAFASVWIASGIAGARATFERAAWCVAAVTFFFPVFQSNWIGNVGSLVAVSISLVALGGVAAGLGATFGALLKVSPGALLPVALVADSGSRRAMVASMIGIGAIFFLLAPDPYLEYPRVLRNMLAGSGTVEWNLAPANQALRYGATDAVVAGVRTLSVAAGVALVGLSVWLARKPGGVPAAVVAATAAMLVVPGTLWYHYLAAVLPIAAMAWVSSAAKGRMLLFVTAALITLGGTTDMPVTLAGLMVLLVVSGRILWQRRELVAR